MITIRVFRDDANRAIECHAEGFLSPEDMFHIILSLVAEFRDILRHTGQLQKTEVYGTIAGKKVSEVIDFTGKEVSG